MTIAFTTVHGSHLYGLAHADSDRDRMIVYNDDIPAVHRHKGKDDAIHVGMFDLLAKAGSGSHQFMEGLFSEQKEWADETYRPLVDAYRVPVAAVREKYERTIHKFSHGDLKRRRHAVRLNLFLIELELQDGRANPTLKEHYKPWVHLFAENYQGEELYRRLIDHG